MANPDNLKKITSTKRARELGSKGAKAGTIRQKLNSRKYCYDTCPLWETCWAKYISLAEQVDKELKKAECALKKTSPRILDRTIKLLHDGEDGFDKEIIDTLLRLATDYETKGDAESREKLLGTLLGVKKSLYGDKRRIDANLKGDMDVKLTAADLAKAYKEHLEEEK